MKSITRVATLFIILENKGGENEVFAKSKIKNAKIVILPKNLQVYAYLNKYPDREYVMFTDKIEIKYRANKSGSILSMNGLNFKDIPNDPVTYKVYMTNKSDAGRRLIKDINHFHQTHLSEFNDWYQSALHAHYPGGNAKCPL